MEPEPSPRGFWRMARVMGGFCGLFLLVAVWTRERSPLRGQHISGSPLLPGGSDASGSAMGEPGFVVVKTTFVETIVSLGTQSWRVRTVWCGTRVVVPVTIISVLLSLAEATLGGILTDRHSSVGSKVAVIDFVIDSCKHELYDPGNYSITRLMTARWQNIKVMGKSDSAALYLDIAAMLVESFAPNAAWIIALLVSSASNAVHAYNFFNDSIVQVEVLTFFLVIYRVFSGRAWNKETESQLSALQWNGSATQQVGMSAGRASNGRVNTQGTSSEVTTSN